MKLGVLNYINFFLLIVICKKELQTFLRNIAPNAGASMQGWLIAWRTCAK
jgi:hypothetical protein